LACKYGARQVYAVDPSDVVFVAQELAQANGFADRIEFIHDLSTRITLPERADIIVSDIRGLLPLFGQLIPSIVDARQRHLAPGGRLIPERDILWAALIDAPNVYKGWVDPWNAPYGLDMEVAKKSVLNSWGNANTTSIGPANLLTKPQIWAVLDYTSIEDPNVGSLNLTLEAIRDGLAHGWLIWFDTELTEGIGFSNSPEADKVAAVYGRGFFPLLEPISITQGDPITFSIRAELVGEDYSWRWFTRVQSQDDPKVIKAEFEQTTTFDGISKIKRIMEHDLTFRPSLSEKGEIDFFVLGKINNRTTIAQIAQQTKARFPDRFSDKLDALIYVYELSQKYRQ